MGKLFKSGLFPIPTQIKTRYSSRLQVETLSLEMSLLITVCDAKVSDFGQSLFSDSKWTYETVKGGERTGTKAKSFALKGEPSALRYQ